MIRQVTLSPAVPERMRQPRNDGPLYPCDGYAKLTGPGGDTMEVLDSGPWGPDRGERISHDRLAATATVCPGHEWVIGE